MTLVCPRRAASLSHDLRTVLASIQGPLEMVLDGDIGEVDHEARELLTRVHRSSVQLSGIVSRFEDASATPARVTRPTRRDIVLVDEIVAEVTRRVARTRPDRSPDLQLDEQSETFTVHGDRHQLAAVFSHIIHCATRCAGPRQRVRVSVRRERAEIVVTVNEPQERFLRLFSRAGDVEHDLHLGLGLVVVRSVLTAHAGTMSLSPARGGQVRVVVRLPAASTAAA